MMRIRQSLPVALLSAVLVAVGGAFSAPVAIAQNSVTLWVTFGATEPGVGCSVDVTVDGGARLAGASVSVVVSGDASGAVISSDSGSANGSGVTWLTIDTNGATAGTKGWASVSVNGAYVDGQSIWMTDGGCSDGGKMVTMNGSAPSSDSSASSGDESVASDAVVIPGAIAYQQQRHLSCEYSSLAIATGMLGDWVSEYDFSSIIAVNDNPH